MTIWTRSTHLTTLVLRLIYNKQTLSCRICGEVIFGSSWSWNCGTAETCRFKAHEYCAKLGQISKHRVHSNHDLTLSRFIMNCNSCKVGINSFNLFCRICNIKCVLRFDKFLGMSHRGQKVNGATKVKCSKDDHCLFKVLVSRSYPTACTIYAESSCGKVVSKLWLIK